MEKEYFSAVGTDLFDTVLFNYDEWLAGDKLKLTVRENLPENMIYRGWMLKPEDYTRLYNELKMKGSVLLTSPQEYTNMHLFPNVYPHIEKDTAGIILFADRMVDVEVVRKRFSKFMVKDSVKSVKGTDFPAFFDQDVTQEEFDQWMKVFYKYRGNLLTGGICVKEFLDLKHYGDKTNEFRVFYADHQVISICRNSLQPEYTKVPSQRLISKYTNLDSPFYTIDYAELTDGTWKIIEAGDGGVSGLSEGQNQDAFFRSLYNTLRGV